MWAVRGYSRKPSQPLQRDVTLQPARIDIPMKTNARKHPLEV